MSHVADMTSFIKFKHLYSHKMLYEDLVANPEAETRKLLGTLQIDLKYTQLALKAFKNDSQQGLFGGRGSKNYQLDINTRKCAEKLFQEYGIPLYMDMSMDELRKIVL